MTSFFHIYIWKKAPFLRLLIPVICGIVAGFYCNPPISFTCFAGIALLLFYFLFPLLSETLKYRWRVVQGVILFLFLVSFGMFITWQKNIRHHPGWYGNFYDSASYIIATVNEPLQEKPKSYKALITVNGVLQNNIYKKCSGNIVAYFPKDTATQKLQYGDQIIFKKPLQKITGTGNPGSFDYGQYCAFQQIFHQAFLKEDQWVLLNKNSGSFFKNIIFKTRDHILQTLTTNIKRIDESSLAKALLIGYRIDLDKGLVQAYSNTGVVHLIAISGMHLSMIYVFLVWIFARIPVIKKSKITRLVLILFCLWFFSLLTGAPASVLRCAVMFTFIAAGESMNKKNSVFNSLAISAFILLCYDPYILWDVGFQLSYLAILGIVILQKNIYNWFYFKNKISDFFWKGASVCLAAQVFTLPVCIYYFHQFPLLFLLANLIAIPLSTFALWGCIAILTFSWWPPFAMLLGKITGGFIWLLNHFILFINNIPFSLWEQINISPFQTILLYVIFISVIYWLIKKNQTAFTISLIGILFFTVSLSFNKWQLYRQKKIVVYNISKYRAVDFIERNNYHFTGDSNVVADKTIWDYNIKPAHIAFNSNKRAFVSNFYQKSNFYQFFNCRLLLIDTTVIYKPLREKIKVDYIIVSKNARIRLAAIAANFECNMIIFDASNSLWKIEQWKKECEELLLHFHSVPEQGAFVINL